MHSWHALLFEVLALGAGQGRRNTRYGHELNVIGRGERDS
jgi:hypothetical protein